MLEAFIIVCAATFSYEIYPSTCFPLYDEWGPYMTEENCDIRTEQMVNDVIRGSLNPLVFEIYLEMGVQVELLYAEGHCRPSGDNT
jgi:hypothetical protein